MKGVFIDIKRRNQLKYKRKYEFILYRYKNKKNTNNKRNERIAKNIINKIISTEKAIKLPNNNNI